MGANEALAGLLAARTAALVPVEDKIHRLSALIVRDYMVEHDLHILRVGIERSYAVDFDDEDLDIAIGNLPLSVIKWGGGDLDYHIQRPVLESWITDNDAEAALR